MLNDFDTAAAAAAVYSDLFRFSTTYPGDVFVSMWRTTRNKNALRTTQLSLSLVVLGFIYLFCCCCCWLSSLCCTPSYCGAHEFLILFLFRPSAPAPLVPLMYVRLSDSQPHRWSIMMMIGDRVSSGRRLKTPAVLDYKLSLISVGSCCCSPELVATL